MVVLFGVGIPGVTFKNGVKEKLAEFKGPKLWEQDNGGIQG